jgi:YidC/Oxa1 family membrane protein insertase
VDFINQAMFFLLTQLHDLTGSYGWAIILVTILIRAALWPVNNAQTRSMKKMQELQPKLKLIQEKFKSDPQKMQEAMMKFYSENKFNPFAGCLPILIQIPIFIGLYGCLNSPQFLAAAGNENFFFVEKLYTTLSGHAGPPNDNMFSVDAADHFSADNKALIYFKADANGKTKEPLEIQVPDPSKILTILPTPLIPGEPITFEIPFDKLGLSRDYNQTAQYVELPVINQQSREMEKIQLIPQNSILSQKINTTKGTNQYHMDVLALILIYGVLTVLYQQFMSKNSSSANSTGADATQAQVMKLMPLMFVGMLFFIPIPAGVMLYLVVTTALMLIQTALIYYQDGSKDSQTKPSERVIEIKTDQA